MLLGARTLLVAPGIATRNKKLLEARASLLVTRSYSFQENCQGDNAGHDTPTRRLDLVVLLCRIVCGMKTRPIALHEQVAKDAPSRGQVQGGHPVMPCLRAEEKRKLCQRDGLSWFDFVAQKIL